MIIPLQSNYLVCHGTSSFFLVACATHAFSLYIETVDEEYSQWIERGDLIVISAPEGGELMQAWHLCELVRRYHIPVVALPKGHPGSSRLKMVVSAGERVELNCGIIRGTHPEQYLICASSELSGMQLARLDGDEMGVRVDMPDHMRDLRFLLVWTVHEEQFCETEIDVPS
ncbi:MAG: alpha/beta hydrolase [Methanomicrobiales archaeon]|jgi:hypothetical protein|nr:alpha/beta hydrolase [Methanomicrobiales archaeon]